jgi:hypothetical protein
MSFKVHFFKASFDKAPTLYRKGIYKEVLTLARKPCDCSVVFTHEKIVKQRILQKEVNKSPSRPVTKKVENLIATHTF